MTRATTTGGAMTPAAMTGGAKTQVVTTRAVGLAIAAVVSTLAAGCGLMVDSAYLLVDGTRNETAWKSEPTERTFDRIEYEGQLLADGSMSLECVRRTRVLERRWSESKTYEYQRGFSPSAYGGAAIVDGIFGLGTAGLLAAICTKDDADCSAASLLWVAPWALDFAYSMVRRAGVDEPVLVDKTRGRESVHMAQAPVASERTACDAVASVWVGQGVGPTDDAIMLGQTRGETKRRISPGAIEVAMDATGRLDFSGGAAALWAKDPMMSVWILDAASQAHQAQVDRCALLRPYRDTLVDEQGYPVQIVGCNVPHVPAAGDAGDGQGADTAAGADGPR